MDLEKDLGVFFKRREFADKIITIGGKEIVAIFDADYVGVATGGADAESAGPAITGKTSDLDGYPHDTAVTVQDAKTGAVNAYKVAERMPDGTGVTVIMLREA